MCVLEIGLKIKHSIQEQSLFSHLRATFCQEKTKVLFLFFCLFDVLPRDSHYVTPTTTFLFFYTSHQNSSMHNV